MTYSVWRGAAALLALPAMAVAQAPLSGGAQNKNQPAQNSNQAQPNASRQGNVQGDANRTNATENTRINEGVQRSNANVNGQNATDNRERMEQNTQRMNADTRGLRRENRAQRRTAMRPNGMRGPDIGLWFNRGDRDGLVISDVSGRGAISKLGFREKDQIVSVNGRPISREPEFIEYLLASDADRVPVVVTRDGREETIYVQPSVLTEEYERADVSPMEQFGVVLDDRYDDRVVVWKVVPRSPAYYAGIREGDVITTFGDRPYHARSEFEKSLVGLKSGEANIQVRRGDRTRDLSVDVPEFERSDRSADRNDQSADRADRHERSTEHSERSADRNDSRSDDRVPGNSERSELRDAKESDHRDSDDRNDRQHDKTSKTNSNSGRDSNSGPTDNKDKR